MNEIPHSCEVERAVVGAMLFFPKLQTKHAPELSPVLFYDGRHATIIRAMLSIMDAEHDPADVPRLTAYLSLNGKDVEAGGSLYLTDLICAQDIPSNIAAHLRTLRNLARLRRQQMIGRAMQELSTQPGADPEEIERRCAEQFDEPALHDPAIENGSPEQIAIAVVETYDRAEQLARQGKRFAGLDVGFPDLSNFVAGLEAEMTVLAARPSIGKTTLAQQIAVNVARNGVGVGFFTLEMPPKQLGIRMATYISGVDPDQRRRGTLNQEDRERYINAVAKYASLPIYLYNDRTIKEIRSRMMRHLEKHQTGLWIIDYLHKIRGGSDKDHERLNAHAEQVAAMAVDFNTPVLLLSQLNRVSEGQEDKLPELSELRGSGGIEEHAVNVWMIYRPGHYEKVRMRYKDDPAGLDVIIRLANIMVEKQREGRTGVVKLGWDPSGRGFVNATTRLEYYPSHDNQ